MNGIFPTDYKAILQKIEQVDPVQYGKSRNFINGAVTYLSPYISRGVISTKQVLNSLFGFNWSFTIETPVQEAMEVSAKTGTVVIKGSLKVKIGDEWITKEQFGRKEVVFKKELDTFGQSVPLDFGNDMKAAGTDAKKKCASELGLFADVYSQEDFFEAEIIDSVDTDKIKEIAEAYNGRK